MTSGLNAQSPEDYSVLTDIAGERAKTRRRTRLLGVTGRCLSQ
jgi:hypothetical protein